MGTGHRGVRVLSHGGDRTPWCEGWSHGGAGHHSEDGGPMVRTGHPGSEGWSHGGAGHHSEGVVPWWGQDTLG